MVEKMHETMTEDRPAEEEKLDQAMTTMDPILQASLKREQKQRLRRNLLYGGLAMAVMVGLFFVVLFNQDLNPDDSSKASQNLATAKSSESPEELSKDGWALWQSGNSGAAEQKFLKAVATEPKGANHWNGLGWSQIGQQKYDSAIESFQKCVKLDGANAGGLNGLGQAYLARREYDLAEPFLRRAMKKGASAATYGLARIYLLQQDYGKAKTMLVKLKTPTHSGLDGGLIDAMTEAARTKTLNPELRKKIEPAEPEPAQVAATENGEPDRSGWSAGGLSAKGWYEFRSGNYAAAEKLFRMALEKDPKMDSSANGLGFALLNQGNTDEAQPIFERLVKVNPKHGGYVNGLARCFKNNGDLKKAVKLWKTQEKDSGPPDALTWGIARSLVELKEYDEALPYLKRIKAAGGEDLSSIDALIAECEAGK